MSTHINAEPEYTPPNKARAQEQQAELNAQIQAFLNGGGVIEKLPSDIVETKAERDLKAKTEAARIKGLKKMRKKAAPLY